MTEIHTLQITILRCLMTGLGFRVMVFNATFKNVSVILWRSVLFAEESHNVVSSTSRHERDLNSHRQLYSVIGTDLHTHVVINPITIRSRPINAHM